MPPNPLDLYAEQLESNALHKQVLSQQYKYWSKCESDTAKQQQRVANLLKRAQKRINELEQTIQNKDAVIDDQQQHIAVLEQKIHDLLSVQPVTNNYQVGGNYINQQYIDTTHHE